MKLHEAIEILKKHNEWRRNDEHSEPTNPRDLSIAIDIIVEYYQKNLPK
jgi:hypothetical protein